MANGFRDEEMIDNGCDGGGFDAVSAQVALEMAEGVLKLTGSDIGISTTGFAGPAGGSDKKPVGLVYIGIAAKRGGRINTKVIECHFLGTRGHIRVCACKRAFGEVIQLLREWE